MFQDSFQRPQVQYNPLGSNVDSSEKATSIQQKVYIPSRTLVIDSRERDYEVYPTPSVYQVKLGDILKNTTSLELKAVVLPRASYNVHSSNKFIDFSIGSTITEIILKSPGVGYTVAPSISISAPNLTGGVQATAVSVFNTITNTITGILITNPGLGYLRSKPPSVIISGPTISNSYNSNKKKDYIDANAIAYVGTLYTAELRPGQYAIGGNPTLPDDIPSELVLEIQNALNYAVNGMPYDPVSTSPFVVRLVSQYPLLGALAGTPEAFDTNAAQFNRIQITNVNSDHWELLWGTGPNRKNSAQKVMGFSAYDQSIPVLTMSVPAVTPFIIPAGTTIRGSFDYNLLDDPTYVVISITAGSEKFQRITSIDPSLNMKFATIIFDANPTDAVKDTTGDIVDYNDIQYLNGPVEKGAFYTQPGTLKALKGADFDTKKISFNTADGKIANLLIEFTKYGTRPGGSPEYYDFQGRENMLIFELQMGDLASGQRS